MNEVIEMCVVLGIGGISSFILFNLQKKNDNLKAHQIALSKNIEVDSFTKEHVFKSDSALSYIFFEYSNSRTAASLDLDVGDQKEMKSAGKYKRRYYFAKASSVHPNFKRKDMSSFKVIIEGTLLSTHPLNSMIGGENYIYKETIRKEVGSTKFIVEAALANQESFYLQGSDRTSRIKVKGLVSDRIIGLMDCNSKIETGPADTLSMAAKYLGPISAYFLGSQLPSVDLRIEESSTRGIINGVKVCLIADFEIYKDGKFMIANPSFVSKSREDLANILFASINRNKVIMIGAGLLTFFSAYYLYTKRLNIYRRFNELLQKFGMWLEGDVREEIYISTLRCRYCRRKQREILMLPCNHLLHCVECYNESRPINCPECRAVIQSTDRIYS